MIEYIVLIITAMVGLASVALTIYSFISRKKNAESKEVEVNLSGITLSGANLNNANLNKADLSGANFQNALLIDHERDRVLLMSERELEIRHERDRELLMLKQELEILKAKQAYQAAHLANDYATHRKTPQDISVPHSGAS